MAKGSLDMLGTAKLRAKKMEILIAEVLQSLAAASLGVRAGESSWENLCLAVTVLAVRSSHCADG